MNKIVYVIFCMFSLYLHYKWDNSLNSNTSHTHTHTHWCHSEVSYAIYNEDAIYSSIFSRYHIQILTAFKHIFLNQNV